MVVVGDLEQRKRPQPATADHRDPERRGSRIRIERLAVVEQFPVAAEKSHRGVVGAFSSIGWKLDPKLRAPERVRPHLVGGE